MGFDYRGNDIASDSQQEMASVKNSEYECQIWCQDTSECKFFTYSKNDKKCYLKTDDFGKTIGGGLISGPKFCHEGLRI